VLATAAADTLPLPPNLIGFDSDAGAQLLIGSEARAAYWPLSMQFVTQKDQAFCGVASLVMVLNALHVPAPATPGIEPYTSFTQDNVLDERTEKILPLSVLLQQGMTLDQFAGLAGAHGLAAEAVHADQVSLEQFRAAAAAALGTRERHVVVNYLRRALGQERGGHLSPLAAYDAHSDRFLVLDVSRYKYPPVWVQAAELYAAMDTVDADNAGRKRGYVLIRPIR
jgi:hypothetical protein